MIRIGEYNDLEVCKSVEFGVYLGTEEERVLLPTKWVPEGLAIGDSLRVFCVHRLGRSTHRHNGRASRVHR